MSIVDATEKEKCIIALGSIADCVTDSDTEQPKVLYSPIDDDNPLLLTVNMPIGLNYGTAPENIAVNNSNLRLMWIIFV